MVLNTNKHEDDDDDGDNIVNKWKNPHIL
jgi:hypothetical protein